MLGNCYVPAIILPFVARFVCGHLLSADDRSIFMTAESLMILLCWLPIGGGIAAVGDWLRNRLVPMPGHSVLQ